MFIPNYALGAGAFSKHTFRKVVLKNADKFCLGIIFILFNHTRRMAEVYPHYALI